MERSLARAVVPSEWKDHHAAPRPHAPGPQEGWDAIRRMEWLISSARAGDAGL